MKNLALTFLLLCATGLAGLSSDAVSDRSAVERVYHKHRLGNKPPFEKAMPRETVVRLVRQDADKEAMLRKAYGVVITPAQLGAEVQRINATTRAPEILAELKAALDNDRGRFASVVAKPVLVERLLRERFDADEKLHTDQRRDAEEVGKELVRAKKNGASSEQLLALLKEKYSKGVNEVTWQLGEHPAEGGTSNYNLAEIQKRFGPNAQILSSPATDGEPQFYFKDLPPPLQAALRDQLREAGDVSAVMETPNSFALYMLKDRTATTLTVAALSLRKRSYEQWLAQNTAQPATSGEELPGD